MTREHASHRLRFMLEPHGEAEVTSYLFGLDFASAMALNRRLQTLAANGVTITPPIRQRERDDLVATSRTTPRQPP